MTLLVCWDFDEIGVIFIAEYVDMFEHVEHVQNFENLSNGLSSSQRK
jgi:hypothetical protein